MCIALHRPNLPKNHHHHHHHHRPCPWKALIIEYVKHDKFGHALALYQDRLQVHDDVVVSSLSPPDGHVFAHLLKACTMMEDLYCGNLIHSEIARRGLLGDVYIGSTLVDMYAKCGSLKKAQEVFDKLPLRNVVTWTALIAGYAENGHGEEALQCLTQIESNGLTLDASAFVCVLKACGVIGIRALRKGQELHADIVQKGLLERNVFIGSVLVDMYAKCGYLAEASSIFSSLKARNVVIWTALLSGYVEHGLGDVALSLSEQMQIEKISPNAVTLICWLRACGSIKDIQRGDKLYMDVVIHGLENELLVGNAIIDMYAKCESMETAAEVFEKHPVRDVVSWNTLIAGYVEYEYSREAFCYLEQMQHEGILQSAITYVCALKACASIRAGMKGQKLHAEVIVKGLEADLDNSILIDMYAKCGLLIEALELFDKIPARTVAVWNSLIVEYVEQGKCEEALYCLKRMQNEGITPDAGTLICTLKACSCTRSIEKGQDIHVEIVWKGLEMEPSVGNILVDMYGKSGLLFEAQEIFNKLSIRNVVSWTALLVGYFEHGCSEEALYCFEEMQHQGISPNFIAYICSLKACASVGSKTKGRLVHMEIIERGFEEELLVGNILVDMYAKCGSLAEAHHIFDKLQVQDVVSCNALVSGYAQLGNSENVFHTFNQLIVDNIEPNLTTFISVLNACSHAGLVVFGQIYFEALINDYCLVPTRDHFTCMVDILARAGDLATALSIIEKMPFLPDIVIWHIVMGACRKWANLELGRDAFEQALELDEKNEAVYVCMSNIYLDAFMQKEVDDASRMQ